MAKILWLNWSGGGNLPPSLGIARALDERGHRSRSPGRPEMVRAGRARRLSRDRAHARLRAGRPAYPQKWIPRAASFLSSPAVAEQIRALVAAENGPISWSSTDVPGRALTEAARFDGPTVAVCHTCVCRGLEMWRKIFECSRLRVGGRASRSDVRPISIPLDGAGHDDRDDAEVARRRARRTGRGAELRHVGPSLERERHGARVALPWPRRRSDAARARELQHHA